MDRRMFNRLLGGSCWQPALAVAVLLSGSPVLARASSSSGNGTTDVVGNSGLKLSQAEALRQFEGAAKQEYIIGPGDEIQLQVPGQPDLQGHHIVGPDGRITLLFAGPIKIKGLTREKAAEVITKAWDQYYSAVTVTVQVTKYGSNRVVVVGRVASPGPLYFETAPTLLEALAKSGAYSPRPLDSAGNAIALNGAPTTMISRCAIYRGTEQVLWIDMKDLFASGTGVDLHLRKDDVVYVPDEQEDLVSVLGQVQHPGAVRLTADTRLVDVLAMAGGMTDDAAKDRIKLVRPSTGMTREVALKDLLKPVKGEASEVALQRGDVIYVEKSGIAKVGYVLGKFSTAGSLMTFSAILAGR